MAFDPKNYKVTTAKPLPVVLLLDTSGSMSGEKIDLLYDATKDMIKTFSEANSRELSIEVAIITFGNEVNLHTRYTKVTELEKTGIIPFIASGMTPLGTALRMAKDMIEDKNETPSKIYRPAVVLVSDGQPNDEWRTPLDNFVNNGRSSKCQRFAVAIGNDVDMAVLEKFTGDVKSIFNADNANDIEKAFKTISMSVSVRAKSQSSNSTPISIIQHFDKSIDNDDDDDDY